MAETKKTTARKAAPREKETEQGYRGAVPDETPNENYTVAGVLAAKPVPETEAERRRKGRYSHRR